MTIEEEKAKAYEELPKWEVYACGCRDQREKDIEKAYNWIRNHVKNVGYLNCYGAGAAFDMQGDEFAEMFKAAMEEK